MEVIAEVKRLAKAFYTQYPHSRFPDILHKDDRPYNVLLIETHADYYICIPFRSNINHEFAFMFQHSQRSRLSHSGLDYTKICIITNGSLIDDGVATVDQDEFNEARENIQTIAVEAERYIYDYVQHCKGVAVLSKRSFRKRYWYTSLKYFHKELGC